MHNTINCFDLNLAFFIKKPSKDSKRFKKCLIASPYPFKLKINFAFYV